MTKSGNGYCVKVLPNNGECQLEINANKLSVNSKDQIQLIKTRHIS